MPSTGKGIISTSFWSLRRSRMYFHLLRGHHIDDFYERSVPDQEDSDANRAITKARNLVPCSMLFAP